jgi:Mor family transcriptional regulator
MINSNPELDILLEIVGSELLREIKDRLGGQKIYIPKDRKERRDAKMIADYNDGRGLSLNQLVVKYDLSYPQVRSIVRPYRQRATAPDDVDAENPKESSLVVAN